MNENENKLNIGKTVGAGESDSLINEENKKSDFRDESTFNNDVDNYASIGNDEHIYDNDRIDEKSNNNNTNTNVSNKGKHLKIDSYRTNLKNVGFFKWILVGVAMILVIIAIYFGESKFVQREIKTVKLEFYKAYYENVTTHYKYLTLQEAINNSQDEDTIKVLGDVTEKKETNNSKKLTLDLNGKTITFSGEETANKVFINNQTGGEFTIKDASEVEGEVGKIISKTDVINNSGTLEIITGEITSQEGIGVKIQNGSTTTITGGTIEGYTYGIFGESSDANNQKLTIGDNLYAVSTTEPKIKGETIAGISASPDTYNFYDGQIIGPTSNSIIVKDENKITTTIGYGIKKTENEGEEIATLTPKNNYLEYNPQTKQIVNAYDILKNALDEVKDNNTIETLKDTNESQASTLSSEKHITFDLNGHTIKVQSASTITNNGTMTIKGSGTLTTSAGIDLIKNSGTLNLEHSGTISNTSVSTSETNTIFCTENTAQVNMNGTGIISSSTLGANKDGLGSAIRNGIIKMTSGEVKTTGGYGINSTSDITITGGKVTSSYGRAIHSEGDNLTISCENNDDIIIEKSSNNSGSACEYYGRGTATLTGATFNVASDSKSHAIFNKYDEGKIIVDNIVINQKGSQTGIRNDAGGTVIIKSATITTEGGDAIYNNSTGTINIESGKITSKSGIGLHMKNGTVTLGEDDLNVSIVSPSITGSTSGVKIEGGKFNFYDGILTGPKSKAIEGTESEIAEGCFVKKTTSGSQQIAILSNVYEITLNDMEATTSGIGKIYETYGIKYSKTADGEPITETENPITVPTKDNYIFLGYYTDSYKTQIINSRGFLASTADLKAFKDKNGGTLYAKWKSDTYHYEEYDKDQVNNPDAKPLAQYKTLEDAFKKAITGNTIKTIEDAEESDTAILNSDKTLILDLNGKEILMSEVNIDNKGTLTIKGKGKLSTQSEVDLIVNSGTLNLIQEGTIINENTTIKESLKKENDDGSKNEQEVLAYNTIKSTKEGEVNINATGNIETFTTGAVLKDGNITIDKGNITATGGSSTIATTGGRGIDSEGKLTINGGSITSKSESAVHTRGENVTISGNDVKIEKLGSERGAAFEYYGTGTATLGPGEIRVASKENSDAVSNSNTIYNGYTGTIVLNGITVKQEGNGKGSGVRNAQGGNIEIKAGEITSNATYAVENQKDGKITISGGTITKNETTNAELKAAQNADSINDAIYNSSTGEIQITGGIITSNNGTGVNIQDGKLTLGINDNEVSIENPKITGKTYGVQVASEKTFNFYDGKIKGAAGKSINVSNDKINIPQGYEIHKEKTTTDNTETATLKRVITVKINKDGVGWADDNDITVELRKKDESKTYSSTDATKENAATFKWTDVEEGEYHVYAKRNSTNAELVDTGKIIKNENGSDELSATINYYTITSDNGKGAKLTIRYGEASEIELPTGEYVLSGTEMHIILTNDIGYHDAKAKIKVKGNETEYEGNATIKITNTTTINLTATPNQYKIHLELDGGKLNESESQNDIEATYDQVVTIKNPTKDGQRFLGWSSSSLYGLGNHALTGDLENDVTMSYGGSNLTQNEYYKNLAEDGTVTLTAVWKEIVPEIGDYVEIEGVSGLIETGAQEQFGHTEEWRIFYIDNSNDTTYLILSDCLSHESFKKLGISGLSDDESSMDKYGATVYIEQKGHTRDELIKAFGTMDENADENANEYDKNWKTLLEGNSKLTSAEIKIIGTPTMDLWLKSWNETHPYEKLYGENGYVGNEPNNSELKWTDEKGIAKKDMLYFNHRGGASNYPKYYWLATTSANGNSDVMRVNCLSREIDYAIYSNTSTGIRPVIAIPSSMINKKEETLYTWKIQNDATAASLNDNNEQMQNEIGISNNLPKIAEEVNTNQENANIINQEESNIASISSNNTIQIAKIGNNTYETINDAIDHANNGDTIDILENINLDKELIINQDKIITLNLNEKTITSTLTHTITNKGTLTITGSGIIKNEIANGTVIYNTGTMNIENVIITTEKNGGKGIYNDNGNITLKSGKVITQGFGGIAVYNIGSNSSANIDRTIIEIREDGSKGIYNDSKAVIKGGNILVSSDDSIGVYNSKNAKELQINADTEILIKSKTIENYELIKDTDQFKEELEQMKPSYGIFNDALGNVILERATIKVERLKSIGIKNNATGEISLGKVDEKYDSATPIIYAISDNTTALQNNKNGKINFYDGRFVTQTPIKSLISRILEKYEIIEKVNEKNIVTLLNKIVVGNEINDNE